MYEENHCHALRPIQQDAQGSLLGENVMLMPATVAEVRASHESLSRDIHDIKCSVGCILQCFNNYAMNISDRIIREAGEVDIRTVWHWDEELIKAVKWAIDRIIDRLGRIVEAPRTLERNGA